MLGERPIDCLRCGTARAARPRQRVRLKIAHPARLARGALSLLGTLLLLGIAANLWVLGMTRTSVYDDIDRLPIYDVAIVLGTSPYTHTGNPNALFKNRIQAAACLYNDGRVRHLLVSGANPSHAYNEPQKMYQALRDRGVPDSAITLDFAGFRTLDSIVRARRIFGLRSIIVVSQRYHEYRALFLARHSGIQAAGFVWPGEDRRQPLRTEAREYLARIKAVLDLYLLGTEPRFLGPKRPIEFNGLSRSDFWASIEPDFLSSRFAESDESADPLASCLYRSA